MMSIRSLGNLGTNGSAAQAASHYQSERMIREIDFSNPAGNSSIHWDGRDGSGNEVFSDVFWVKTESDHFGKKTFEVAGVR